MKDLGLTEYEAKLYTVLALKSGNVSVSEISRLSRVPYTKAYSTLSSLEEKGLVEVMRGKPVLYRAIEPETALADMARGMVDRISKASEEAVLALRELGTTSPEATEHGASWNISGKRNVVNRLVEELERATAKVKFVFPNLSLLDARILAKVLSASRRLGVQMLLSPADRGVIEAKDSKATVRYSDYVRSRYALFDDRYSLMIAVESPDIWTGVFETCGNCTRQSLEHFNLAWDAAKTD